MAEFSRATEATDNGFPGANMFHQPDLEALLFDRVDQHPSWTCTAASKSTRSTAPTAR